MLATRRTAMKAMLAAVMAPVVNLRSHVPDERLLKSFCLDPMDYSRFSIDEPFQQGRWTFGTDSRALVRCELVSPEICGERRLPAAVDVFNKFFVPETEFVPLGELDLTPRLTGANGGLCPECGDRRVVLDHFPDSQASADSLPGYDPDENSIRDASCTVCRGRDYPGPTGVDVLGVVHDAFALRRIQAIPDVKVARSVGHEIARTTTGLRLPISLLLFRSECFEGMSMPVEDYSCR